MNGSSTKCLWFLFLFFLIYFLLDISKKFVNKNIKVCLTDSVNKICDTLRKLKEVCNMSRKYDGIGSQKRIVVYSQPSTHRIQVKLNKKFLNLLDNICIVYVGLV